MNYDRLLHDVRRSLLGGYKQTSASPAVFICIGVLKPSNSLRNTHKIHIYRY